MSSLLGQQRLAELWNHTDECPATTHSTNRCECGFPEARDILVNMDRASDQWLRCKAQAERKLTAIRNVLDGHHHK